MTITIQLTEIPDNETVTTRVFTLPDRGGDFGTNFDCFIKLPDRTGQVASVHGHFVIHNEKMSVESVNGNKIKLNGIALASGRTTEINDGTMIEVFDYIMLVSKTGDDAIEETYMNNEDDMETKSPFSLSSSEMSDDNVIMKNNTDGIKEQAFDDENMVNEPHFSSTGVFSDDPFDDDPFKDEDIYLNETLSEDTIYATKDDNPVIIEDSGTLHVNSETLKISPQRYDNSANVVNDDKTQENINQLISLLDRQLVSKNDQQSQLFKALEKTLSTFLEEFSPQHLTEEFSDFGTPFFVNKEQQYWRLYRKSFNRRMKKGDYTRLFKALLLENIQLGEG
jgi:predicted component of type VI protein secretion system